MHVYVFIHAFVPVCICVCLHFIPCMSVRLFYVCPYEHACERERVYVRGRAYVCIYACMCVHVCVETECMRSRMCIGEFTETCVFMNMFMWSLYVNVSTFVSALLRELMLK